MIETLRKIEELIDQNKILEQRNEELRNIIEINLNQNQPGSPVSISKTIDLAEVETLLLKFYQYNKVSTSLFDDQGKLLFSAGVKPFCYKYMHCGRESNETCFELVKRMSLENSGKPTFFSKCPNSINMLVIPITVRKTNIAFLIISQFLKHNDVVDTIAKGKIDSALNQDLQKVKDSISQLPVYSALKLDALVQHTSYLAEMMAYLCKKNHEFYEKTQHQADKEMILAALRDKILEQETLLKKLFHNIMDHQHQVLDNTISKSDRLKEVGQLNKKLERTEILLNALLTSIPLGIGFVKHDVFTYVNDQMFRITGYTSKELIGRGPSFLFAPEVNGNIFNFTPEYHFIRSNNSYELQINHKEGEKIESIVFTSPLNTEDLEEGWTVSILDITAMKEMQKELLAAKEKAEESDRLKNAFLANMSHELRTPMNALIGFTELLSSSDPREGKKKEYFKIIQQNSRKLLHLIDDIIDVSKITTHQLVISKRKFSLNQLLKDIYRIYNQYIQSKFGTTVCLKLSIPEGALKDQMYNDDIRLRQVFGNLLSNSIKFTTRGEIEFGYIVKGTFIEFFIKDTGQGIKKAQMAYIFDQFRQGDESYTRLHGGAGLGLTLAKNFIELMGGKIWLESRYGKGSTFFFTLPLVVEPQPTIKEADIDIFNLTFDWSDKTILIAEDEEVNFLYLQHLLSPTNINIKWAKNGQKAIDFYNQDPNINLILMDIKMPVVNGLEATKIIKSKNNLLPIIAQTAYAHGHNREDFINAGCDEFIPKPINSKLFIALLQKFLNTN